MRQRIFMDHSSKAKTFINEEFTIRALDKDISNFMVDTDGFRPNLHVYDSDGEELPIVKTKFLIGLYRRRLSQSSDTKVIEDTQKIIRQLENKEKHIIWVKFPENKKMKLHEIRVINFEYDAIKERKPGKTITTEYNRQLCHSVIYVIRKPEDYEFSSRPHITFETNGEEPQTFRDWDVNRDSPIDIHETFSSTAIDIDTAQIKSLIISYSFTPSKNIISFPIIGACLLSIMALLILVINNCDPNDCFFAEDIVSSVTTSQIQFLVGIIAASIVIPGLIRNDYIRNSYKYLFMIPVAISIVALFLKF